MSDEIPVDEYRADYYKLRDSGEDKEIAKARAIEIARARRDARPSKVGTFVRGAAQGGSLGFGDEIAGGMGALAAKAGLLDNKENLSAGELYRQYRDEARAADNEAQTENPKTFLAGQVAGGVATTPLMPAGSVSTLGRAIGSGAAYGVAGGFGSSKADVTKGDFAGAATDAVVGGVVGAAAGGVGYGAVKALGAGGRVARNKLGGEARRVSGAAKDVAADVAKHADDPSLIGQGETVRSASQKAQALQDEWAKMGVPLQLRPSQATGDRAAALAESRLAQFPTTMQRAQAAEAKQLEQGARLLDAYVDHIAADPSKLGRADVSDQLVRAVDGHIDSLVKARSAAAGPLYEAAEKAGGGVDVAPIMDAMRSIVDENKFNPSGMVPQLRSLMGKLEQAGAGGALSIGEAQNLRSLMGQAARGKVTIIDGLPAANQQRIARQVLGAIDGALDASAQSATGQGATLLRQANAAWRSGSQAIEDAATETVGRILKTGATDASDTVATRLLNASPAQVGGVFKVLNKADPASAQQLRAQMLDDIFAKAGKRPRDVLDGISLDAADTLNPMAARKALLGKMDVLRAAYEGDSKAKFALARTHQLLQRLSFGPNLKGAQTAPLAASAGKEIVEQAAEASGPGAGLIAKKAFGLAEWLTGNAEAQAQAMTSREGIEAFNGALSLALTAKSGKPVTASATQAVMTALSRVGIAVNESAGGRVASADQQQAPPLRAKPRSP